jgi:hypothetical protein
MKGKKQGERRPITRRDFLKGTAYGTVGLALGINQLGVKALAQEKIIPFAAKNPTSKIVLIRHEAAVDEKHRVNSGIVQEMVDTALKAFTGKQDAVEAWKSLIRPEDTVGVKYTHCGWMRVHTEDAVVTAIVKSLRDLGIPKKRIYAEDGRIPLAKCTALINVPSVKVHALTGIGVSIKNYVNFSSQPSAYHDGGSMNLGEVWLFPEVKGKTRLVIVDALRPYFGPGPQINPLHRWDYKGILVGTDPVALDATCLRICQVKRNLFKGEEWIITPPAKSIAAADTKYHLGTSDPAKIQVIRLGWEKDLFI